MELRRAPRHAQLKPNKCNTSRIPKCRPISSQQLSTSWYQRDMRSPKRREEKKRWNRDKSNDKDKLHECKTSRIPKYRPNRLQQPATNWYHRDMRSNKKGTRGEKMLEPRQAQRTKSTTQATQMQHVTHTEMWSKPPTATCYNDIGETWDQQKRDVKRTKS